MGVLTLPLAICLAEAAALSAPPTGTHVMEDVSVTADEPRFVAPTRRDRSRSMRCSTRSRSAPPSRRNWPKPA